MTTWYTADLHLGHRRILEYAERPFRSVDQMHEAIVDMWNETVAPGDSVWLLGDVALGDIDEVLDLVQLLHGTITLIPGNHDRCWIGRPDAERWREHYLQAGFSAIVDGSVSMRLDRFDVQVSHFPITGDARDVDRFTEHRPKDRGGWTVHGHVHTKWAQRGRSINVGLDVCGFRPMSEAELIGIMRNGPDDAATHALP